MTAIELLRKEKEEIKKKINNIDIKLCGILETKERTKIVYQKEMKGLEESYSKFESQKQELNSEYEDIKTTLNSILPNLEDNDGVDEDTKPEMVYLYLFVNKENNYIQNLFIVSYDDILITDKLNLLKLLSKFFNTSMYDDSLRKYKLESKSELPIDNFRKGAIIKL